MNWKPYLNFNEQRAGRARKLKLMDMRLWNVYNLNVDYRNDMMKRAAHERLVRFVRQHSKSNKALHRTAMKWAGRRLVASGYYLLNAAESKPKIQVNRA